MDSKKKIAFFILLSLIGIVLVVLFRPQRINSEFETKHYWTYKAHTEDTYDFVFYGDSRIYRGVSPEVVLEGTKYSGYNFGFSSGSLSAEMLSFIENRLDRSENPTIVLGVTPHSLTQESLKDVHFHQERNRPWDEVLQRYYIHPWLYHFDRITPEELLGYRDWVTHEWVSDDGWMKCDNISIDTAWGLRHYEKILADNPIDTSAVNHLFQKVEDWTSQGIEVYAYRPPTFLAMEELEDRITGFDETQFIKRFESAGGKWLEVSKTGYQTYDGSHLKDDEVIRLSEEINRLMRIH